MEYQIKFRGIDKWNRPVYKVIDKKMYFGSTDTLFNDEADEEKVNEYFKDNTEELEYFGSTSEVLSDVSHTVAEANY